jgi:hypothetical protein
MAGIFGGGAKKPANTVSSAAPAISGAQIMTSCYGRPVPLCWGQTKVAANLIWYSDFTAVPHTEASSAGGAGGKGGDSPPPDTSTVYTYTAAAILALCAGVVSSVRHVWRSKAVSASLSEFGLTLFGGSYSQAAWAFLTTNHAGQDDTYHGLAYVANSALDLGDSAQIDNYQFEVAANLQLGALGSSKTWTLDTVNNRVTCNAHGFKDAQAVVVSSSGVLPAGLTAGVPYYVLNALTNTFQLADLPGGDAVVLAAGGVSTEDFVIGGGLTATVSHAAAFVADVNVTYDFADPDSSQLRTAVLAPEYYSWDEWSGSSTVVNYTVAAGVYTFAAVHQGKQIHITYNWNSGGSGVLSVQRFIVDAEPTDVMADFLSNADYGAGFPAAKLGDRTQARNYCMASGIFISPALVDPEPAASIVARWSAIANLGLVYSEDQLKFVPYGDTAITANGVTFTPNTTAVYAFIDSDFRQSDGEEPVVFEPVDPDDVFNQVSVSYCRRANDYTEVPIETEDQAAVERDGVRPAAALKVGEVCDDDAAWVVLNNAFYRVRNVNGVYTFAVDAHYALLEPMDLVTVTEATGSGLVNVTVRVTETQEDGEDWINCKAEPYTGISATGVVYPRQKVAGARTDLNAKPGSIKTPIIFDAPGYLTTMQTGSYELWIAIAGGASYGGCEIWASWEGVTYQRAGVFNGKSRFGKTTGVVNRVTDPDVTSTIAVDLARSGGKLASATQKEVDRFATLCWLDGELIAYQTATLTGGNAYNLGTRIRRGVYGTEPERHANGAGFVRLDKDAASVFRFAYNDQRRIGQTVYLKFLAFNKYGAARQALSDVKAYAYTIKGPLGVLPLPPVNRLELEKGATSNQFTGKAIRVCWGATAAGAYDIGNEPTGRVGNYGSGPAGASQMDPWFADWQVDVFDVANNVLGMLLRTEHVTTPRYAYTHEKNAEDHGGQPMRDIGIQVRARSKFGDISEPATIVVTNPAPEIRSVALTSTVSGFRYVFTAPLDQDILGVKIYASPTSGYTPDDDSLARNVTCRPGQRVSGQVSGLASGLTHYARLVPYDSFGDGVEYG